MMHSLSNLQKCTVAIIAITLYLLYQERSTGFDDITDGGWQDTADRIIVFGDDWSDTSDTTRHSGQGELWTETLCKELGCEIIENFARSRPMNLIGGEAIPVIDAGIHSEAMTGQINNKTLIDFKAQVQQFLALERSKPLIPRILDSPDNWTVFTVFFGLWDLLEYSTLETEYAMKAVDNSMTELFTQLDLLASHMDSPIKVVLPMMVDTTFLPRFKPTHSANSERFAQVQHQQTFLSTYWNAVLLDGAARWQGGEIFVPDTGAVVLEQARAKQLHSEGISDTSGSGKAIQPIQYVEQPCLIMLSHGNSTHLQAAATEKCTDPDAHLFWDDLQLGSTAMELIGRQAAGLVCGNKTVTTEGAIHEPSRGYRLEGQERIRFNLKLPPGY